MLQNHCDQSSSNNNSNNSVSGSSNNLCFNTEVQLKAARMRICHCNRCVGRKRSRTTAWRHERRKNASAGNAAVNASNLAIRTGADHDSSCNDLDVICDGEMKLSEATNPELEEKHAFVQVQEQAPVSAAAAALMPVPVAPEVLDSAAPEEAEATAPVAVSSSDTIPPGLGLMAATNSRAVVHCPLYVGSRWSIEQACVALVDLQTRHIVSNNFMVELFCLLKRHILPEDNQLPSCYSARKMVTDLNSVPVRETHMCVNDCKPFVDPVGQPLQQHQVKCKNDGCEERRYEQLNVTPESITPKILSTLTPRKVFHHFLLRDILRSLFSDATTVECLEQAWKYQNIRSKRLADIDSQPDATYMPAVPYNNPIENEAYAREARAKERSRMTDIWDSPKWQKRVIDNKFLSAESPANIVLAISTDGVNPFRKEMYSVWPIMATVLNYPSAIRTAFNRVLLLGLISGPLQTKKITTYLKIVVNEINELYASGVEVYDALHNKTRLVRVQILLILGDYPATCKMLRQKGSGAKAGCTICHHRGIYSQQFKRTTYTNHKQYLTHIVPLRTVEELKTAAVESDNCDKKADAANHPAVVSGKMGTGAFDTLVMQDEDGGSRSFDPDMSPPETMHVIEGVMLRLFSTFMGLREKKKAKSSPASALNSESTSAPASASSVSSDSKSPDYLLDASQKALIEARLSSITLCTNFCSKAPRKILRHLNSTKANDWHHMLCYLMPYAFRDIFPEPLNSTLMKFCKVMKSLLSYTVYGTELDKLHIDVISVVAKLEDLLPETVFTIQFHRLVHMVQYVQMWGPCKSYWMYPFERYVGFLVKLVHSRVHPEKNLINNHILFSTAEKLQANFDRERRRLGVENKEIKTTEWNRKYKLADYVGMERRETVMQPVLLGEGKEVNQKSYWEGEDQQEEWAALDLFYKRQYPEYAALVAEWEVDVRIYGKRKRLAEAKRLYPLCSWTRRSGVQLTSNETLMQLMSKSLTKFMKAKVGRYVIRAAEAERNVKTQQSNIAVPFLGKNGVIHWYVGRVLYFFKHFFVERRDYACIKWFKRSSDDPTIIAQIVHLEKGDRDIILPLELLQSAELVLLGDHLNANGVVRNVKCVIPL